MIKIYKEGKYYNPASKHYEKTLTNVVCDRCYRNNLDMSIGWNSYDLCLDCVSDIKSELENETEIKPTSMPKKMKQRQFKK